MSEKIKVNIKGMHCRSCEILVERNLKKIAGVESVNVNYKSGTAELFSQGRPDQKEIQRAIENAGYSIGKDDKKHFFSRNVRDYNELIIVAGSAFILFVILKLSGLLDSVPSISAKPTFTVAILVGLTAGVSTCMALVGGLVLGLSARHAELHPEASRIQKFRPHIFFNIGRILSYAILGGLIGMLGSAFAPTGGSLGLLVLVAGAVMLFLGLKLIQIFPKLENAGLYIPKSVSRFFGAGNESKQYSNWGAAVSGALTFFLPCGFTQAMQVYAITSGSFSAGAMILGAFALGTAPGLLGLGAISSLAKGVWSRFFFKFVGVVVIVLGIINMRAGINLTGFTFPNLIYFPDNSVAAELVDGVQVIKMRQLPNGYSPNEFTVKAGIPVKWEIESETQYTCASYIVMPAMKISKALKVGNNIINFTPEKTGRLGFSCSMGMYTGVINVI